MSSKENKSMTTERAKELQENIAKEAAALMLVTGDASCAESYDRCVRIIGEAWKLSAEDTERSLGLIECQRQAIINETSPALPADELPINATGMQTLENLWGLFETAMQLDNGESRIALFNIARELEEVQSLRDWIGKTPEEQLNYTPNTPDAMSLIVQA